jgi:predicted DNA-binding transcriptional regulator AlpA
VAAKTAKTQKRRSRRKRDQIFCYTKDLMAALGITRRSVYQYVQRRLLPAPILYSNGKTGVRARWSVVALDHAEFIVEQREIGYTLNEIAAMIAARWGTHDKVPLAPPAGKPPPAPSGNTPPSQGPPAEPG